MGVFDFVRNAGAKIGIGKSTDEIAEEAQAERDAAAAEAAARRNKAKERMRARADAKRTAENAEKRKEARKSVELEKYVRDMGLEVSGLDIRFDDGTAYIDGETADAATKERVILAVGNAQGVSQVDESLTVAQDDGSESEMYVVEKGDTLWAIATATYGDGSRYPEIFEANKPMLTDPDLIFPGQVLRIPQ
ncbi:MAG: peptidoglycan-binding protein LysM [Acidimicrobiia bacterium]|nr:peptidoglycan-binding protein LysM [Acidimicrobiia bacterium]